jgi:hypothetical protein
VKKTSIDRIIITRQGSISRGIYGLPKVSLGPAMPYNSKLFQGSLTAGQATCCRLTTPLATPYHTPLKTRKQTNLDKIFMFFFFHSEYIPYLSFLFISFILFSFILFFGGICLYILSNLCRRLHLAVNSGLLPKQLKAATRFDLIKVMMSLT